MGKSLAPLTADVACLDTHMQRVYLSHMRHRNLPQVTYLEVEAKIRRIGETTRYLNLPYPMVYLGSRARTSH